MKLTPLADRVVLKAMEAEETTKGGIILTSSAKEKPSSSSSSARATFWPLSNKSRADGQCGPGRTANAVLGGRPMRRLWRRGVRQDNEYVMFSE